MITGLPQPDSARFERDGASRSNTKCEYVVLVYQNHYLLAHVFTVYEKLVDVYLYRMLICRVCAYTCVCILTPTNLHMHMWVAHETGCIHVHCAKG